MSTKNSGNSFMEKTKTDLCVKTSNKEFSAEALKNSDVDLLNEVKRYIKKNDEISKTRIQREFCVGYPKASEIMDILIHDGLVSVDDSGRYEIKK